MSSSLPNSRKGSIKIELSQDNSTIKEVTQEDDDNGHNAKTIEIVQLDDQDHLDKVVEKS